MTSNPLLLPISPRAGEGFVSMAFGQKRAPMEIEESKKPLPW